MEFQPPKYNTEETQNCMNCRKIGQNDLITWVVRLWLHMQHEQVKHMHNESIWMCISKFFFKHQAWKWMPKCI
jgi:hypothetical protein